MNFIIDFLKERNIDTTSIRDELKLFVNEGIYITGGTLSAKNISVGRWSKILRRNHAKKGKSALMDMPARKGRG